MRRICTRIRPAAPFTGLVLVLIAILAAALLAITKPPSLGSAPLIVTPGQSPGAYQRANGQTAAQAGGIPFADQPLSPEDAMMVWDVKVGQELCVHNADPVGNPDFTLVVTSDPYTVADSPGLWFDGRRSMGGYVTNQPYSAMALGMEPYDVGMWSADQVVTFEACASDLPPQPTIWAVVVI